MSTKAASGRSLAVIYSTVALDAAGIGLVFLILPRLIQDVTHRPNVAPYVGWMAALYAAMQFVFAPVLGALSDRLGRRPVLLVSLAGAAINYLVMALAPQLWMLMLGRAVAGLTSANVSVATAYITDVTPGEQRARRFGLMGAMFGAGFIIGPVLGGVLGEQWVRLPFVAAAALNAGNLLMALFALPESHPPSSAILIDLAAFNPLRPLRWLVSMPSLLPLVIVYFALSGAGEAYGICWALWGYDAFRWNGFWVGLSLGAFGIWQTVVQAALPGPATKFLGQRGAVLTGIGCSCVALVAMAFASHGWVVFAIMPLFALGSIGTPALQALATEQVSDAQQGQLQGLLASSVSLASIIAPLGFSGFYFMVQGQWPGAVWLAVAAAGCAVRGARHLTHPHIGVTSRVRGGTTSTAFEAEAAFLHSLLEAVAARAGVSKMTVYSHFADKETTFETVVRAMSDEMMSAVSGPGQGAAPLRDRLNTVGIGFLRLILDPSVRMMGHTLSASLHKDQALARRFYDAGPGRTRAGLAAIIAAATARGELATDSLEWAADDLVSLWVGSLPDQLAFGVIEQTSADEIARRARRGTEIFLRAYARPGNG